jgi:hypothetical protein
MTLLKKFTLYLLLSAAFLSTRAQTITSYARKGLKTSLEIGWLYNNYGTIQWQRSTNNGTTWSNVAGATAPVYEFTANEDGLYRAMIIQPDCDPVYITRAVKVVDFTITLLSISANSVTFGFTNADFRDASIKEFGFSYNLSELNTRSYLDMNKSVTGNTLPVGNSFELTLEGLNPGTSYSIRFYLETEDGSVIYGPGRIASTLPGLKWTHESWQLTQTAVAARFELPGYTSVMGNPNVEFKFGTSPETFQSATVTHLGNFRYQTTLIEGLTPGTSYLAQAEATIDGEKTILTKEVITLPDYTTTLVDQSTKPIQYTIRWDKTQTMVPISPPGLNSEYPRMVRVNNDTILCAYHGGSGSDHWVNIYLQKSYDNGRTWKYPTILMDKERSNMGNRYWRFANPELIKLRNGWILMSFIGNGNPETNDNSHVMVMISKDNGETWGDPRIIGRGRTWEPMVVQLPNDELELYVASEAAWWGTSTLHQEILFSRSTDNGETWTELKRAAYSPERRDGMPVALVMQGNKGILFAIEIVNDKGFGSPSLVHRPLFSEWDATPWNGVSTDKRWNVSLNAHGGAPYILQLPTGEIVLTAHVNGRNGIWQTSYPRVTVGNNNGKNFTTPVTPLTTLPANQGAYYNSLFLKDHETVWLVVTHSLFDGTTRVKGEIKYVEGKIVPVN